jgi:hypothetical protein
MEVIRLARIAFARRIVNLCLFSWLAAQAFQILQTPISGLFILSVMAISLFGIVRLTSGLGTSSTRRVLFLLAQFVPLLNLFAMGLLSAQASRELSLAGYSVGLFEAKSRR